MSKTSRFHPPTNFEVRGATAPDGTPYILVKASGRRVWVPRDAFTGSGSDALAQVRAAGLPLLTDEWAECRRYVSNLKHYPARPLIARPGWNGEHFALIDGTVFSPPGSEMPVVLFQRHPDKCRQSGTIAAWRRATALLRDQHVATFILLTAYAAPLLAFANRVMNIGFELAGDKGVGKSTIQRVTAAVCGPADDPKGSNYWITANTTINGLEPMMAEHNDMAMIIEETNLFAAAESEKSRAAKFNDLVFKLANGTVKRRFGEGASARSRFIFVTSTNEPLVELLRGQSMAVSQAASDRLLTIPIDRRRPYGMFDALPSKWSSSSDLARALNSRVSVTYGLGIRRFLEDLVRDRATRPHIVDARLHEAMDEFRSSVGVDANSGSAVRVADAFGLIYAAGKLARHYGAISGKLDPLRAAIACYDLNRAIQGEPISVLERLLSLRDNPKTLRILKLQPLTDAEINSAPALLRRSPRGWDELLLNDKHVARSFPIKSILFRDPAAKKLLVAEPGRKQTKRRVRAGAPPERFYCFRLKMD